MDESIVRDDVAAVWGSFKKTQEKGKAATFVSVANFHFVKITIPSVACGTHTAGKTTRIPVTTSRCGLCSAAFAVWPLEFHPWQGGGAPPMQFPFSFSNSLPPPNSFVFIILDSLSNVFLRRMKCGPSENVSILCSFFPDSLHAPNDLDVITNISSNIVCASRGRYVIVAMPVSRLILSFI